MNLNIRTYSSHRTPLVAGNGVVATSHPLAAQAGLAMLQAGGTAVDAAIATAVALTVLEPTSNGIGSDALAIVWDGQRLHGLNGSGRAPAALTPAAVERAGYNDIPASGWLPVTVPGAPAAWQDLHARFGELPFAQLFAPAIAYAERGYPVAPVVARYWARGVAAASRRSDPMYAGFLPTFAPGGAAPSAGERFASPGHARTLRLIAEHGAADFYSGEIARAIAGAHRYIADPERADVPVGGLLDPAYLARRRALIGETARAAEPGDPPRGGTVYLCAADGEGRMVSMIQSNFVGFGSGVVVPGWGIALQNRGSGFTLEPGHPNRLEPGKRPYHTIIPAFLTHGNRPIGPFGVMGGHMQPQGHIQVAINTIDYAMNPQAALDAPRWRVEADAVLVELETARHVIEGLAARGHNVRIEAEPGGFGRGQAIWRLASGAYAAGSETRCDGCAVGW